MANSKFSVKTRLKIILFSDALFLRSSVAYLLKRYLSFIRDKNHTGRCEFRLALLQNWLFFVEKYYIIWHQGHQYRKVNLIIA